jgi:hypothetical protein
MSAGIRRALPAVRSLNVTDADVEVSALGDAMASATFTREIVMEGTGATVRQLGAVSWLWPKGRWSVADRSRSHLAPAGSCEIGREVVQHRHGAVDAMAIVIAGRSYPAMLQRTRVFEFSNFAKRGFAGGRDAYFVGTRSFSSSSQF